MAEETNKQDGFDYNGNYVDPNLGGNTTSTGYNEESAAEIAEPINYGPRNTTVNQSKNESNVMGGTGLGWLALALSIISLFVMPVLMGAAGIIIGFIARRRGAKGLGAWAIGIGAISIIVGIFILPFF